MRDSIRWRLPLTYAAVALLTTLALGAVLLLTLRSYYLRVERETLRSNAQAIGLGLAQLLEEDPWPDPDQLEALQSRLDSFSFLLQTRVRLLDAEGQLVAGSDSPERYSLAFPPMLEDPVPRVPPGDGVIIVLRSDQTEAGSRPTPLPGMDRQETVLEGWQSTLPESPRLTLPEGRLPALPEAFLRGFETGEGPFRVSLEFEGQSRPSDQVVVLPISDSGGDLLGQIELSEGPAYAREIVSDVAWVWGIASAVAVVLAAVVGWRISRRISAPLVALTEVTASMAGGDLGARADVARKDEFGALAQSYNQMADRVEGTVVTLRRFVSDAAHEIHTPLTALQTHLELARQDAGTGKDGHVVEAQAQVARLEALTSGLLDLSRIESGSGTWSPEAVPLAPLVQALGEVYASQAEQAGLAFDLYLPDAELTAWGDEAQLHRALANLLDNALKFTPEGGRVGLGARREGEMAALWVEDTGIGIPEEDLPHLFQRFHRGRNTAAYPGSGLGLAIVRAIVGRHGGEVEVEVLDPGTRLTLRLPGEFDNPP